MKIKKIYDNGGETLDRYTVYYDFVEVIKEGKLMFMCISMNCAPFHPQGIGIHGYGELGNHNGKEISFEDLPKNCQKAVKQDLEG